MISNMTDDDILGLIDNTCVKLNNVSTPFYMKTRMRGVKPFSDIYGKTDDAFIPLPGVNNIIDAAELAAKVIEQIMDIAGDIGNVVDRFMVAQKHR